MKKKYKRAAFAVIAAVCLIVWGGAALAPIKVEADPAERGDLERKFTVQAEIEPSGSTVLNAPVSGRVTGLPYRSGREVEMGEVLLTTDTSQEINMDLQREQLRQQLNSARQQYDRMYGENGEAGSRFAQSESQYQLAQKNYDNAKALTDSGDLAQAELDRLRNEREVAYQQYVQAREDMSDARRTYYQDQIASYERQLEAVDEAVSPGTLYMPFHGVVWETYVEEGAYLSQNQPVMKVYPSGDMKLAASVLAEDSAFLDTGMTAEVVYPSGERTEAEVTFIARTAAKELSSTGIEESRCRVELADPRIPGTSGAGQQADVTFTVVKAESVLTVASSAILPQGKESAVYVIRDKKSVPVTVETGRSEGGRTEILSGLSEGELVVTDPYEAKVKDGSRVKVTGKE